MVHSAASSALAASRASLFLIGWACWKTYLGRSPEEDYTILLDAMSQLGNGLYNAGYFEDASSVMEAQLSTYRRHRADEESILSVQNNLSATYQRSGSRAPQDAVGVRRLRTQSPRKYTTNITSPPPQTPHDPPRRARDQRG